MSNAGFVRRRLTIRIKLSGADARVVACIAAPPSGRRASRPPRRIITTDYVSPADWASTLPINNSTNEPTYTDTGDWRLTAVMYCVRSRRPSNA